MTQVCQQFQDLPSAFQMSAIRQIIPQLSAAELEILRKRVKRELGFYTWAHIIRPPKPIPSNATTVTAEFCKLTSELTLPTIINLLPSLSDVDQKDILVIVVMELNRHKPTSSCSIC